MVSAPRYVGRLTPRLMAYEYFSSRVPVERFGLVSRVATYAVAITTCALDRAHGILRPRIDLMSSWICCQNILVHYNLDLQLSYCGYPIQSWCPLWTRSDI